MDDLHTDTTVDRSPFAFPLLAEAKARANAFLGKFDLKEEGYFCFQDRTTLYKSYIKSSMKEGFDEQTHLIQLAIRLSRICMLV
jgi:hypothetical protein